MGTRSNWFGRPDGFRALCEIRRTTARALFPLSFQVPGPDARCAAPGRGNRICDAGKAELRRALSRIESLYV